MRQEVRTRITATDSTARSALRGVGRAALWVVLGLLVVRVLLADPSVPAPVPQGHGIGADPGRTAFAVRFARTYLSDPSAGALAPLLAEGAKVGAGAPPSAGGPDFVLQAEVVGAKRLGDGHSVLTVACELRDARVLYLAVPIARSGAGEVAALGAPSLVAAPSAAGVDSTERPQPIAGSAAGPIEALVAKFLPEYVAASDPGSLSYLVAPGAVVQPLAGALSLAGVSGVSQLGPGEGPRRAVLAAARLSDPESGASYPVVYRLALRKGGGDGRWYVEAIEGASA